MLSLRASNERGLTKTNWLHSWHSFSFGHYFDQNHQVFSDLLVINDDIIAPGKGFAPHPHRDMEIFTYVLQGALAHEDSTGTGAVIYPGDVQIMSAGTGIRHSEYNHNPDLPVHLLQIWIQPQQNGLTPRYQQLSFSEADKRGCLRLILSPSGENGSLTIHQDVRIYAGCFNGAENIIHKLPENRATYVQIARGTITINGTNFTAGDGIKIHNEPSLTITNGQDAELLLFDLRA